MMTSNWHWPYYTHSIRISFSDHMRCNACVICSVYFLGMQFLWLCRNASENFPKFITDVINGKIDILSQHFPGFSTSDGEGCYRDGQYALSNITILELRTSEMMQNETYVITLVVRKGNRTSFTTQILELGPENLPRLAIR